jgi:ATP-binding cassette subfamily B protein
MLAMGAGHFLTLLVPRLSGLAIDTAAGTPGTARPAWVTAFTRPTGLDPLWAFAAAVVLVTAAGGAFQFLRARGAAMASEAIVRRLRDRLFGHLAELPRSWHDGAETGDLVQRCSSDVETVRVFLSGQVVEIGHSVLLLLIAIPLMLRLDVAMTLVAIGIYPLILFYALAFFRRVRGLFTESDEAEGRMTTVLQENLTGIRVVRAFARGEYEQEKFGRANGEFRDRTYHLFLALARYWGLSDCLCMTQLALVLSAGIWFLVAGSISVGMLFTFLLYASFVMWPVRQLGRVLADSGKAMVSLKRIREVLAVRPEDHLATATAPGSAALDGEIRIEGLTFAFRGDERVLDDVSLTVAPGETVALVGPPGCGKSVLIHLLLRLYDYEAGSIRLDGRELSTLPRRYVRARIGAVLQEPFLYSRTVEANLRVGRAEATEEEMIAAATDAALHDSIRAFDHGYRTVLGERGITLSGGQRQRMALARALLKDPDILVLDDALSAVDTKTERRILDALARRHGRRTTILVSHRLSSIAAADRIYVLSRGRIVESGTHEQLCRAEGPYRRLWRIQGALEEEIRADTDTGRPE